MSAILPQDLLSISSTEIQHPQSTSYADVVFERAQVLHMFWKVHAIRYKVSRQISDERSQNLFWRTWSDTKLSNSISTTVLTALWNLCRGDLNLSAFNLVVKPRLSQSDVVKDIIASSAPSIAELPPNQKATHGASFDPFHRKADVSRSTVTADEPLHDIDQYNRDRVPSIIDTARETILSNSQKPTRSTSVRNMINRANNTGRERGSTRGRARPSLGRRRSTQSSRIPKSSMSGLSGSHTEEVGDETLLPNGTRSTFILPSASSWEDELSAESGRVSPAQVSSETARLAIDRDFRGRFAERIASVSNMASMNKLKKTGSVVRFADEIPSELRKSKEPLSTTFEDEPRPSLPHRESIVSVAISDGDADEDLPVLPSLQRTTSSLSMLLRKAQLEDGSLPSETQLVENFSKKKGKGKEKDIDEGEALLAMGRRGGVTKAGGIQLPPQQQLRDDIDSSFSSSSPDRIF